MWNFKAYDINKQMIEGKMEAETFHELALKLRQQGLQVVDATRSLRGTPKKGHLESNPAERELAEERLEQMRRRMNPPISEQPPKIPRTSLIRWALALLKSALRRK